MAPPPMRPLRARARFTSPDRHMPGRRLAPLLAASILALSAILTSPHSGLLRPDGGRALAACLDAGHSYLFRLRMKLPASIWSNWVFTSAPVKFT